MDFNKEVEEEYKRYRVKYPKLTSFHHAFGLLFEEGVEFFDEVKKKTSKRNLENARHELVQIAALARCVAEDLT